jgi:hypothetical protein
VGFCYFCVDWSNIHMHGRIKGRWNHLIRLTPPKPSLTTALSPRDLWDGRCPDHLPTHGLSKINAATNDAARDHSHFFKTSQSHGGRWPRWSTSGCPPAVLSSLPTNTRGRPLTRNTHLVLLACVLGEKSAS